MCVWEEHTHQITSPAGCWLLLHCTRRRLTTTTKHKHQHRLLPVGIHTHPIPNNTLQRNRDFLSWLQLTPSSVTFRQVYSLQTIPSTFYIILSFLLLTLRVHTYMVFTRDIPTSHTQQNPNQKQQQNPKEVAEDEKRGGKEKWAFRQ